MATQNKPRIEHSLLIFIATAIVVVIVAVIALALPKGDERTNITDSEQIGSGAEAPTLLNVAGVIESIDVNNSAVVLNTDDGRRLVARVDDDTTITVTQSALGVDGLQSLLKGDQVTVEFRQNVAMANEIMADAAYIRVYTRAEQVVRKADPLPQTVTSVSGTVASRGEGSFQLNSDGGNFSDPAQSPAQITITIHASTQLLVGSERYTGIADVLNNLPDNARVTIQSGSNIRNQTNVTAARIRVF